MPIIFQAWITRADLRAAPEARFVFGDNHVRVGMGGQAGAMRGEPNAIGVATKWRPTMDEDAFFSDEDPAAWKVVESDLAKVQEAHAAGLVIILPKDGLGTGLSQLPTRAPRLQRYIVGAIRRLHAEDFPWK